MQVQSVVRSLQFALQPSPCQNSQLTVCSRQLPNKKRRGHLFGASGSRKILFWCAYIAKRHVARSPKNHRFRFTPLCSQRSFKETMKQAAPLTRITLGPAAMRTKLSNPTKEDLVCVPQQLKTVFFSRKHAVSQVQLMRPYIEEVLVDHWPQGLQKHLPH